jgi:hypothetical protein
MVNPLAFLNPTNIPASSPEEAIAQRLLIPTDENLKIVADLKASIQSGLKSTVPGNTTPVIVDSLNDADSLGLTVLGVSPSGRCSYFRRADGALVQRLNGKMSVM